MKKSKSYNEVQEKSNKKSKFHTKDNLDSNILFQIAKYLKKKYHMPWNQIKIENSIKFTNNYYEIIGKKIISKFQILQNHFWCILQISL